MEISSVAWFYGSRCTLLQSTLLLLVYHYYYDIVLSQGFDHPHDIAVSPDGESVFVGETGPNVVWKFVKEHEWPLQLYHVAFDLDSHLPYLKPRLFSVDIKVSCCICCNFVCIFFTRTTLVVFKLQFTVSIQLLIFGSDITFFPKQYCLVPVTAAVVKASNRNQPLS